MAKTPRELREEWAATHGEPAPQAFAPDLLTRALAYRLQEKGQGGLRGPILKSIRKRQAELAQVGALGDRPPPLRPGTRLARDWHGKTHHVTVTKEGFDYGDQHYQSLTAIARLITGVGWSSPRFFGLTSRAETPRA